MITIRLLDARRGLNRKCEELFGNAKIAEAIYRFLCDGIEECEDAESERKRGKWIEPASVDVYRCSVCEEFTTLEMPRLFYHFCPNCGAEMREEVEDDN